MKKAGILAILVIIAGIAIYLISKQDVQDPEPIQQEVETPEPVPSRVEIIKEEPVVRKPPTTPPAPAVKPKRKPEPPKAQPKPPPETAVKPPPEMLPPPVEIHKELIPQNIEIIRVYYENEFSGPKNTLGFDINGSGFTKEFEQMIKVESGHPGVAVKNLKRRTPNQIHGSLKVGRDVPTTAIFPQVLIDGKVVFRAQRPFAVIRPGEVLNLVFIEMGESGRSGRFRVFTNLTKSDYDKFKVEASTPHIKISDYRPKLPFIVDASINIGPAPTGNYGLKVTLGDKSLWERDGIIRVVRPNVGDTGLVQRIYPVDGFHRPGDQAKFIVQGSGFRPQDAQKLSVKVAGWEDLSSTFTFRAPGRLELDLTIPLIASASSYAIEVIQGEKSIMTKQNAFVVVEKNWTRTLKCEPALKPGGKSTLILEGRDMEFEFVKNIQIEVDEPTLKIGRFSFDGPDRASAEIRAGPDILPGDYWLKMSTKNGPIFPQFGSIIRIDGN